MITKLTVFFFFNDTATTEIYTLSLHDALPICRARDRRRSGALHRGCNGAGSGGDPGVPGRERQARRLPRADPAGDRKSTRLNSSHANISYAVFCLKKKKHSTASLCIE